MNKYLQVCVLILVFKLCVLRFLTFVEPVERRAFCKSFVHFGQVRVGGRHEDTCGVSAYILEVNNKCVARCQKKVVLHYLDFYRPCRVCESLRRSYAT